MVGVGAEQDVVCMQHRSEGWGDRSESEPTLCRPVLIDVMNVIRCYLWDRRQTPPLCCPYLTALPGRYAQGPQCITVTGEGCLCVGEGDGCAWRCGSGRWTWALSET